MNTCRRIIATSSLQYNHNNHHDSMNTYRSIIATFIRFHMTNAARKKRRVLASKHGHVSDEAKSLRPPNRDEIRKR